VTLHHHLARERNAHLRSLFSLHLMDFLLAGGTCASVACHVFLTHRPTVHCLPRPADCPCTYAPSRHCRMAAVCNAQRCEFLPVCKQTTCLQYHGQNSTVLPPSHSSRQRQRDVGGEAKRRAEVEHRAHNSRSGFTQTCLSVSRTHSGTLCPPDAAARSGVALAAHKGEMAFYYHEASHCGLPRWRYAIGDTTRIS
jgi:hypothetical protein